MNRKIIITLLLAIVCMTVAAQSIDEYQFHSGTAVLKKARFSTSRRASGTSFP